MFRSLLGLAVIAPALLAQFGQLVTTGDGARVTFSSSLSLKTNEAHDWSKLFGATANDVHLIDERFPISPPAPLPTLEAFYELFSRDETSDGSVRALNTFRPCVGGSRCVFFERYLGEIHSPALTDPVKRAGLFRVSADGHYAFSYGSTGPFAEMALLDLWTASVIQLPQNRASAAPSGRRIVSDDGTAVFLRGAGDLMLASRNGTVTAAKTAMPASSAIIETGGRFLIYESAAAPHQLILYDLAGAWELPLVQAEEGCVQPALSDDSRNMLFLSAANWEAENNDQHVQAWIMDLVTGELRQLTRDPAGIAEATLSGDGQVVWAVTLGGRLLRIEVGARTETEIVGRTAALDYAQTTCILGIPCELTGRGLAPASFGSRWFLATSLGGIEVKLDGVPMLLISVAPDRIQFLLPAELQPGDYRLEVTPGGSIFQEKNELTLTVAAPTSQAH